MALTVTDATVDAVLPEDLPTRAGGPLSVLATSVVSSTASAGNGLGGSVDGTAPSAAFNLVSATATADAADAARSSGDLTVRASRGPPGTDDDFSASAPAHPSSITVNQVTRSVTTLRQTPAIQPPATTDSQTSDSPASGPTTVLHGNSQAEASSPTSGTVADRPLSQSDLDAAVAQAIAAWAAARPGVTFPGVSFVIADLPGLVLGQAIDRTVQVDATAAGWGWSISHPGDTTPRMDLVTLLIHELGHLLGYDHGTGVMTAGFGAGQLESAPRSVWSVDGSGRGVATSLDGEPWRHTLEYDAVRNLVRLTSTEDGQTVLDPLLLDGITSIEIRGTGGDDELTITTDLLPVAASFDAGPGTDTLRGAAAGTRWTISGPGSGSVAGLDFTGVENVGGAPDHDVAGDADGLAQLSTFAFALAAPTPTVSWVGATGGSWHTASNWSTGAVPQATDDVYIGLPGQTVTISSGTVTVNTLTCDCDLTVSGATLIVNNASQINGRLTLISGTVGGTGDLTVTDGFVVPGSYSTLSGTGVFTTQGTSTVDMSSVSGGYLGVTGGKTWVNEGSLTIGGNDFVYFGLSSGGVNQLVNAVGATLTLASSHATPLSHYTGTALVTNLGTINATAAGSHAFEGPVGFSNAGTVNVEAGTLILRGGGSDAGAYAVASGTVLNFAGGTRTLLEGSQVSGAGTLLVSGGTVHANGALGIAGTGAALRVTGGVLNVAEGATSGLSVPVTVSGGT